MFVQLTGVFAESAAHFEALAPTSMSALSLKRWRVGERVEVSRPGEGLQGGWFTAVLMAVDRGAQRGSVRYEEMMEADGVTRLSEDVSLDQIRPVPPGIEGDYPATWTEGHAVEAWHNKAWWFGTILGRTSPEPDFPGSASGTRLGTEAEMLAFRVCLQGSEEHKCVRLHGAVGGDGVGQGMEEKKQGGASQTDEACARECSAADVTCPDDACQDFAAFQSDPCENKPCEDAGSCEDDPWDLGAAAADAAVGRHGAAAVAVVVYKRRKTAQGWVGSNPAGHKGGLCTHKGTLEWRSQSRESLSGSLRLSPARVVTQGGGPLGGPWGSVGVQLGRGEVEEETEVGRFGGKGSGSTGDKSAVGGKVRKREGLARQCKRTRGGAERGEEEDRGAEGRRGGSLRASMHAASTNPPSTRDVALKSPTLVKTPLLLKAPAVPPATPVAARVTGASAIGAAGLGTPIGTHAIGGAPAVGAPTTPAAMPATPMVAGEKLRGQRCQLPNQLAKAASEDRRGAGGTVDGGSSSEEVEEVGEGFGEGVGEEVGEEVEEVGEEGVGEEMAGYGVVVVVGSEDEGEEGGREQEMGSGGVAGKRARKAGSEEKGEDWDLEEVEETKIIRGRDETYAEEDNGGGGGGGGDGDGDEDADDGDGDDDVVEVVGEEACVSIVRHGQAAPGVGHHVTATAHAPHAPVTPANAGNRVTSSGWVTSTPPGQLLCSEQHIGGVKRQRFFSSWHRQCPLFQDAHTHTGTEDLAVHRQSALFQDTHTHTETEGLAVPRIPVVHHASSGAAEVNEQDRPSTGSLYREDKGGLADGEGRGGRGVEAVAEAAYGGVLDALWVQGGGEGITWDKEVLLTDLRRALSISNDQHSRLLAALLSRSEGVEATHPLEGSSSAFSYC
ncbi:unnamed protein product, partial [Closterium sp. NIES-65]